MSDIVYFEFNNWFYGRDYPLGIEYKNWIYHNYFSDDKIAKENKIVVVCGPIDMSMNWCITAPKEWVEMKFPELLTDRTYSYPIHRYSAGKNEIIKESQSYKNFLRFPNEEGELPIGRWGMEFLPYTEENIGVHWVDVDWPYEDDEDDE
jgi:hypothetical protein